MAFGTCQTLERPACLVSLPADLDVGGAAAVLRLEQIARTITVIRINVNFLRRNAGLGLERS